MKWQNCLLGLNEVNATNSFGQKEESKKCEKCKELKVRLKNRRKFSELSFNQIFHNLI